MAKKTILPKGRIIIAGDKTRELKTPEEVGRYLDLYIEKCNELGIRGGRHLNPLRDNAYKANNT